MTGIWLQLGLVGFLVLLNAVFAGSEMALVSLRESQLQRMEDHSATGGVLARLARDPNRFLATIQIGITMAGFLASASAAVSLAEPLKTHLGFLGGAAEPVAIILVTLILAYFTLVFGELAPKRIAMQRAERWGLLAARPLAAMAVGARPLVWLLSRSTDIVVRLIGGDPSRAREQVTGEELRDMVASQVTFSDQQRTIIDGAFEIADRTLSQIVRPRLDVFVLDPAQNCRDALSALAAAGYSRAPVGIGRSLDEVIGIVHWRDLLSDDPACDVEAMTQPAVVFPETSGVLHALQAMQIGRVHLAIVVNEHGSAEGIVTLEDLVEELVGEIYDESDRDALLVRRQDDGTLTLPGRFPIHDLTDLGIEVPQGPYVTLAGLLLARLGRIPDAPGDIVDIDRWRFTVTGVHRRAITEVAVAHGTSGEHTRAVRPTTGKLEAT